MLIHRMVVVSLLLWTGCTSTAPSRSRFLSRAEVLPPSTTAELAAKMATTLPQYPSEFDQQPQGVRPRYAGTLTALLGFRDMDDPIWKPVDGQFAGGLEYCFRPTNQWLGLSLGILGSYARDSQTSSLGIRSDVDAYTVEAYLGPKLVFEPAQMPLQFYVGAGASVLYADIEQVRGMAASRSSDATLGVYGHAGVSFRLNRHQNVGIEYRALVASDLNVFGGSSDADYSQVSLIFSTSY